MCSMIRALINSGVLIERTRLCLRTPLLLLCAMISGFLTFCGPSYVDSTSIRLCSRTELELMFEFCRPGAEQCFVRRSSAARMRQSVKACLSRREKASPTAMAKDTIRERFGLIVVILNCVFCKKRFCVRSDTA